MSASSGAYHTLKTIIPPNLEFGNNCNLLLWTN
jgi:hypothetical protein